MLGCRAEQTTKIVSLFKSLNKENERPHKDLDSGVLVTACALICAADCKLD